MSSSASPMDSGKKIADSITELVGRTPMVRLGRIAREEGCVANIVLKMESMEPASSVKDRIAKSMIESAESRGDIRPGFTTLVEATSGNTGIGMAMMAAAKGYDAILVMPDTMSMERRVMLKAYGAKLILTPAAKGVKGALAKCAEILAELGERGFTLAQFENPDNPKVHRETTGPEIWYQTDGAVDFLVSGVGTGGTLTGCTQFLKGQKPEVKTIAVEPAESAVLSGENPGPHKIQGIGAGFIPPNCHTDLIDEIVKVPSEQALAMSRRLASNEGLLVGISGGAAVWGAVQVAKREENAGKTMVVIIPSFGERYLSTMLFADLHAEAMAQKAEE